MMKKKEKKGEAAKNTKKMRERSRRWIKEGEKGHGKPSHQPPNPTTLSHFSSFAPYTHTHNTYFILPILVF